MRINDYDFINPEGTEAGESLTQLGRDHIFTAERLMRALEQFALTDTDFACKVLEGAEIEVYLVPPRGVLAHVPDSAALIRVDHESERIEIIEIYEEYGGYDEPAQWMQLRERALAAV
jgi:hypothetical protein